MADDEYVPVIGGEAVVDGWDRTVGDGRRYLVRRQSVLQLPFPKTQSENGTVNQFESSRSYAVNRLVIANEVNADLLRSEAFLSAL